MTDAGAAGPDGSRGTVLIVEDNADNRLIYRTILEYHGFAVIEAEDGEEGVRRARDEAPSAVLMDISLPLIDGHEATRILKADAATRSIPVIALTAHAMAGDRARATAAGCDAYIAKPLRYQELYAAIGSLLAREEPQAP